MDTHLKDGRFKINKLNLKCSYFEMFAFIKETSVMTGR